MSEEKMVVTPSEDLSITYRGKAITFDHFEPKSENLIKIRIHNEGADGEGIWACVSDEDKKKYDDDSNTTDTIVCNLRNASLYGMPWGTYVIAECSGSDRAKCDISQIDGDVVYNQVDTIEKETEEK